MYYQIGKIYKHSIINPPQNYCDLKHHEGLLQLGFYQSSPQFVQTNPQNLTLLLLLCLDHFLLNTYSPSQVKVLITIT
jgi:hypothetical protein